MKDVSSNNCNIVKRNLIIIFIVLTVIIAGVDIISSTIAIKKLIAAHIEYSAYEINDLIEEVEVKVRNNKKLAGQIVLDPVIKEALTLWEKDMRKVQKRLMFYQSSDYYLESVYIYNENDGYFYESESCGKYDINNFKKDVGIAEIIKNYDAAKDFILRNRENQTLYTFVIQPYNESESRIVLNFYKNYFDLSKYKSNDSYYVMDENGMILISSDKKCEMKCDDIFQALKNEKERINKVIRIGSNIVIGKKYDGLIFCGIVSIWNFVGRFLGAIISSVTCLFFIVLLIICSYTQISRWILLKIGQFYCYTEKTNVEMDRLRKRANENVLGLYLQGGYVVSELIVTNTDKRSSCNVFLLYLIEFEKESNKYSKKDKDVLNFALRNVLGELNHDLAIDIVKVNIKEIAVICNSRDYQMVFENIHTARSFMQDQFDLHFVIIHNSAEVDFECIENVYSKLQVMKEWSFYTGDNGTLDLVEIEEKQKGVSFDSDSAIEIIMHALKENNLKAAFDVMEQPAVVVLPPESAKNFVRRLLKRLNAQFKDLATEKSRKVLLNSEHMLIELEQEMCWGEILLKLYDLFTCITEETRHNSMKFNTKKVEQILELIHNNYGSITFSRELLAEKTRMSVKSMEQIFKYYKGQSITAYIFNYRMEQAKKLLNDTNLTVAEVADRVGYVNASHFVQNFKKTYGLTPDKYRKSV